MTDKRITDLPTLSDPTSNDYLVSVDVSDETSSPEGTTKKVSLGSLFNANNFFGWANYSDSQYTLASPRVISSGVRTQLTNNAGGSQTNTAYLNETQQLWNNNAVRSIAVGDAFDIRVTFKATAATNDKDITFEMDIGTGGASFVIFSETKRMLKSGGAENSFVFAVQTFALDTFLANGGKFYVTATSDINLYNMGVFITKTYRNIS